MSGIFWNFDFNNALQYLLKPLNLYFKQVDES
jgi:hypothetical protein